MSVSDPQILVLGTADWNQPIATNQHYMVRELSRQYDVCFSESLGLRKPEFTLRDLRRIRSRLRSSTRSDEQERVLPLRARVVSPKVVPIHTPPWSHFNQRLLNRQFNGWTGHHGDKVLWTYSPVTYGFEKLADVTVYHCVDLYGEFPGIDAGLIDEAEQRLAQADVTAIGSSEVVVRHLVRQGFKDVIYWPNVADTDEIKRVSRATVAVRENSAVFAGNLSLKKVDFALLESLVAHGVELHLAGPVAEGGGEGTAALEELIVAGARYHGVLTLAELTALMLACKVGLIPYQLNSYTEGVSPLKTYEYLAAGLSVVSTGLPSMVEDGTDIFVSKSTEGFVLRVAAEAKSPDAPEAQLRRLRLAEAHSWTLRGEQARVLIERLLQNGGRVAEREVA